MFSSSSCWSFSLAFMPLSSALYQSSEKPLNYRSHTSNKEKKYDLKITNESKQFHIRRLKSTWSAQFFPGQSKINFQNKQRVNIYFGFIDNSLALLTPGDIHHDQTCKKSWPREHWSRKYFQIAGGQRLKYCWNVGSYQLEIYKWLLLA